jgi:DNA replication protein DnaC
VAPPASTAEVPDDACPICGGAGFVRLDVPFGDPAFGQAVRCKCKEQELEDRRRSELRQISSLGPFVGKTFDTFDTFSGKIPALAEAYKEACRFADDPRNWLLIMGGTGVGKTHLAAAIANHVQAHGEFVFFSIVPDLLDHLRSAFAPHSETTYDALFDKIREAYLLVLDDLGAENSTAWATEKLFQIINYRYNQRMPTVITTNHRRLSQLDERIRSRLSDIGLVQQLVIEAHDYRLLPRNAGRTAVTPRTTGGAARNQRNQR